MQFLMRGLTATTVTVALVLALVPCDALAASPWTIAPLDLGDVQPTSGDEHPDIEAAKAEYRKGSDAYALGNYEEAVEHFERAYQLSQEPALLFDLGQSYTRWYDLSNELEHLKKARRMYENYVINLDATGLGDGDKADARADAQRRITEVDRRIAQHQSSPTSQPQDDRDPEKKPVHKRAWFWVAIVGGLAVIGGVAAGVVLATRRPDEFTPELGTIGRSPAGGGLTLRF